MICKPQVFEKFSPGPSYTEPHLLILSKQADLPGGKQFYLIIWISYMIGITFLQCLTMVIMQL